MRAKPGPALADEPLPAAPPVAAGRTAFLPEVEALRGVAIALVVLFHLNGLIHFQFQFGWAGRRVSLPAAYGPVTPE